MQSRKDQLHAQAFVTGRLVSALLHAEPDLPQTPLRRFVLGSLIGVIIGVIAVAGAGIWGLISPSGKNTWRAAGALIIEKESGARYIFAGGELRPVLNHASAKLLLGTELRVVSVKRKSLRGVPHGLPVGIPSAPDALPEVNRLAKPPHWTACSVLVSDRNGVARPTVSMFLAASPARR